MIHFRNGVCRAVKTCLGWLCNNGVLYNWIAVPDSDVIPSTRLETDRTLSGNPVHSLHIRDMVWRSKPNV